MPTRGSRRGRTCRTRTRARRLAPGRSRGRCGACVGLSAPRLNLQGDLVSEFGSRLDEPSDVRQVLEALAWPLRWVACCPDLALQHVCDVGHDQGPAEHLASRRAVDEGGVARGGLNLDAHGPGRVWDGGAGG